MGPDADEAFEALVRAHGTRLVRLAGALTGSGKQWRVVRRTRLDGRQAIVLSETPAGPIYPLPFPPGYPRSSP